VRTDKKPPQKTDKKTPTRAHKQGVVGYSKKSALLEEAVTNMNTGKYGRSSTALKELLALDPRNMEARRLFATLHLRLGSLVTARQAFESLANEAIGRQDLWLAESLLREYLAAGPRCVPFLELLAHVYEEKGDAVAAVAELGKAIDILIEDADSENPKKPSQLYAKVRELAPASAVACQLASLFDIQTGELLAPHPSASATVTASKVHASQPQDEAFATTETSSPPDVMPWEQFDGAPPSDESPSPTLSNSVIEPLDVPSSEPTGPTQEANLLDQEILPSAVVEPQPPSSGDRDDEMGDEEGIAEVEEAITSSVESTGLSAPMPWEQVENSTTRIEEVAPSPAPLAQSEGVSRPEFVSNQLPSPVPGPDLTEASESIFAAEPSTIPAALPEPEVSTLSAADSSPMTPFSWNTVFDGAWKSAGGTLSPSSPAALSKPGTSLQDARELESVQPESVPEPEFSFLSSTSTPEPLVLSNDPEPLPSALLSEELSRPEELPTISSDDSSSLKVDLSVPSLSEPVEPARESKPVSLPSFMEPQSEAPVPAISAPEPSRPAVIAEAPPVSEAVSTEHHERPITVLQAAAAPSLSAAPSDALSASAASTEALSHWSTGEVEVQPHRPSEKKRNWDKEKGEAPIVPPTPLPQVEKPSDAVAELSRSGGWESVPSEANRDVEAVAPILEKIVPQEDTRPEWVRASESITFVNVPPPSSATWQDPGVESAYSKTEPALSVAASAVDVLFDSTGETSQVHTQDHSAPPRSRPRFTSRVARVRIGISSFVGSCFSTTRSIVLLCAGLVFSCVVLVAVGIGAVGLAWKVMEAPPSSVYRDLTTSPPPALTDSRKNGYFLLLGFDASQEQDPLQAGYERKVEGSDRETASACMAGDEGKGATTGSSTNAARGWFTSADPVAQLTVQAAAVRSWAGQEAMALRRYQQWLSMPFEDAGYGQIMSPNCAHILLAHRLYLAEGFAQDPSTGIERLEIDMAAWRVALGQSKTLMVKMLAAMAVQDDVTIASGLLSHQDLDGAALSRLGKIVRPLDQVELSLRWPMQSHLLWATKAATTSLKNDKTGDRPLYVALAAAMPLPFQQRANAYADYYEGASKAVAEGRYTSLPKPSSFLRTSAVSVVDYVANPIEHILGVEPLPSWDPYVGRMVETDARLRLAGLQVWLRRGAQEGNVLTRLAKAGQAHYDPFTGLPMLVDQQKGVMYSVGQDGKDQEGDPLHDVVAAIPKTQSVAHESSRTPSAPQSQ
jgi:hypothetical protein